MANLKLIVLVPVLAACSGAPEHPPVLDPSLSGPQNPESVTDSGSILGAGGVTGSGGTVQKLAGSGGTKTGTGGTVSTGGASQGAGGSLASGGAASMGGSTSATGGTSTGGVQSTGGSGTDDAGVSSGGGTGGSPVEADAGSPVTIADGSSNVVSDSGSPSDPFGPAARGGTYVVSTQCATKPPTSWFALPVIDPSKPECVQCDETKLSPPQGGCVQWCQAVASFGTISCTASHAAWSGDGHEFSQNFMCFDSSTYSKVTMTIVSDQDNAEGTLLTGVIHVEIDSMVTCQDSFDATK